jgi:hypothetical protein
MNTDDYWRSLQDELNGIFLRAQKRMQDPLSIQPTKNQFEKSLLKEMSAFVKEMENLAAVKVSLATDELYGKLVEKPWFNKIEGYVGYCGQDNTIVIYAKSLNHMDLVRVQLELGQSYQGINLEIRAHVDHYDIKKNNPRADLEPPQRETPIVNVTDTENSPESLKQEGSNPGE